MEDIAFMLKSALPLDDVDKLMIGPRDGIAIIWVDISDRPDLQTLADRSAEEPGYCICTWFYGNPGKRNMLLGLRVEMRQPTRTVFHLAFKVERFIDQLSLLAQAGKLWVVPGPPPAHLVGTQAMTARQFMEKVVAFSGPGVFIELEPHLMRELEARLNEWKQNR